MQVIKCILEARSSFRHDKLITKSSAYIKQLRGELFRQTGSHWMSKPIVEHLMGVLKGTLKAYSLISYRGRSQKFENWNFLHLFVAFLPKVHFPKGI